MTDRAKIIEKISSGSYFYLISHMLPDGDSVGSLLAMGEGLLGIGKEVKMFTPGPIPRKYEFLKGSQKILHDLKLEDPDIPIIVLDSSDMDRLGVLKETVSTGKMIINIDHHVTNKKFGTLNLIDSTASATGEIVYSLLNELQVKITADIAESLYVAIATDTGSFKYDNTTPGTHRVAAELLEFGLEPGSLSQIMFDERPVAFYILLKQALASLELYENQKLAVMTLSNDIRVRSGATTDDLEGIVNYSRNIEGIELGILFYVEENSDIKVGFRSKSIDVSILAGRLNGGGHARASGCRLNGDFETVKEKVLNEALKVLRELPV